MGFAWQRCWKLKRINLISDIKLQKSILFRGSEVWPRCPNVLSSENFPTCVVTYTWEVTENVRRRTFLRCYFTQITIFVYKCPLKAIQKCFFKNILVITFLQYWKSDLHYKTVCLIREMGRYLFSMLCRCYLLVWCCIFKE